MLLLPVGLVALSFSAISHWLFYLYASKLIVATLLLPSLVATSGLRRTTSRLIKGLFHFDIFFGATLYLVGDSLLWLTTPEIHTNLTSPIHLAGNVALVGGLAALATSIIGRRNAGLSFLALLLAIVYIATFFKIQIMHSPIMPMDLLCIREFVLVAPDVLGWPALILAFGIGVILIVAIALLWSKSTPLTWQRRSWSSLIGVVLIASPFMVPNFSSGNGWSPLWQWSLNGTWLTLAHNVKIALSPVPIPTGYSRDAVIAQLTSHSKKSQANSEKMGAIDARPNIVILLVESLIDLHDIGVQAAPDPQTFLHEMRNKRSHSWAVVPNVCGGSSTTEFELLTGMEARMWPASPVPYYSLKSGNFFSIPRLWSAVGLPAKIVQVDPPSMYNRVDAYRKLGIFDVEWLTDNPRTESAKRLMLENNESLPGLAWDRVLLTRMAEVVKDASQPVFLFGFTNGTHAPYSGAKANWELSCNGAADLDEIAGYCDEVSVFDTMCREFWAQLCECERETIVVIVGDHMPPLRSRVGPYGMSSSDPLLMRKVPLLVLVTHGRDVVNPELISTNMIPWYVLQAAGVPLNGAFEHVALNALHESAVISGNQNFAAQSAVGQYRQVQFGILEDSVRTE